MSMVSFGPVASKGLGLHDDRSGQGFHCLTALMCKLQGRVNHPSILCIRWIRHRADIFRPPWRAGTDRVKVMSDPGRKADISSGGLSHSVSHAKARRSKLVSYGFVKIKITRLASSPLCAMCRLAYCLRPFSLFLLEPLRPYRYLMVQN